MNIPQKNLQKPYVDRHQLLRGLKPRLYQLLKDYEVTIKLIDGGQYYTEAQLDIVFPGLLNDENTAKIKKLLTESGDFFIKPPPDRSTVSISVLIEKVKGFTLNGSKESIPIINFDPPKQDEVVSVTQTKKAETLAPPPKVLPKKEEETLNQSKQNQKPKQQIMEENQISEELLNTKGEVSKFAKALGLKSPTDYISIVPNAKKSIIAMNIKNVDCISIIQKALKKAGMESKAEKTGDKTIWFQIEFVSPLEIPEKSSHASPAESDSGKKTRKKTKKAGGKKKKGKGKGAPKGSSGETLHERLLVLADEAKELEEKVSDAETEEDGEELLTVESVVESTWNKLYAEVGANDKLIFATGKAENPIVQYSKRAFIKLVTKDDNED